jgi:hypothetical protein
VLPSLSHQTFRSSREGRQGVTSLPEIHDTSSQPWFWRRNPSLRTREPSVTSHIDAFGRPVRMASGHRKAEHSARDVLVLDLFQTKVGLPRKTM